MIDYFKSIEMILQQEIVDEVCWSELHESTFRVEELRAAVKRLREEGNV